MIELFSDLVTLYNKVHTLHIRTVKMPCSATLHPTLGEHYEKLQEIVDTFGEDIIQKALNQDIPSTSECFKQSTIKDDMIYDDDEEIIDDLYKDYEYVITDIKGKASSEKDLLIQNILIDIRNTFTKLCADISREMEDSDDSTMSEDKKETKTEIVKEKPKMGIPSKY